MRLGLTMPDRLSDHELGVLLALRERLTMIEVSRKMGYPISTLRHALESIGVDQ